MKNKTSNKTVIKSPTIKKGNKYSNGATHIGAIVEHKDSLSIGMPKEIVDHLNTPKNDKDYLSEGEIKSWGVTGLVILTCRKAMALSRINDFLLVEALQGANFGNMMFNRFGRQSAILEMDQDSSDFKELVNLSKKAYDEIIRLDYSRNVTDLLNAALRVKRKKLRLRRNIDMSSLIGIWDE